MPSGRSWRVAAACQVVALQHSLKRTRRKARVLDGHHELNRIIAAINPVVAASAATFIHSRCDPI